MPTVCLDNAQVMVSAPPATLIPPNSSIPAGMQNKLSVDGKLALVKGDVENWAAEYTVGYTSGSFSTPGTLGVSGTVVSLTAERLSCLGDPVLETSQIMLIMTPKSPAIDNTKIPPIPDPQPIYTATVTFVPPGAPVELTAL